MSGREKLTEPTRLWYSDPQHPSSAVTMLGPIDVVASSLPQFPHQGGRPETPPISLTEHAGCGLGLGYAEQPPLSTLQHPRGPMLLLLAHPGPP